VFKLYEHYKIGFTTREPEKRLKEISSGQPVKPEILLSYWCDDVEKEERFLHDKFNDVRVNGEWFKLSVKDIKFIEARA